MWEYLETAGKGVFVFGITSIAGLLFGFWQSSDLKSNNTAQITSIPTTEIPVITLETIENGELKGTVRGNARIVVKNSEVKILPEGSFSTSVIDILPMLKMLPAPEGAQFVASKAGKKYYPLDSPSAFGLAPKNRVFYSTEEEAQKAGKVKGK